MAALPGEQHRAACGQAARPVRGQGLAGSCPAKQLSALVAIGGGEASRAPGARGSDGRPGPAGDLGESSWIAPNPALPAGPLARSPPAGVLPGFMLSRYGRRERLPTGGGDPRLRRFEQESEGHTARASADSADEIADAWRPAKGRCCAINPHIRRFARFGDRHFSIARDQGPPTRPVRRVVQTSGRGQGVVYPEIRSHARRPTRQEPNRRGRQTARRRVAARRLLQPKFRNLAPAADVMRTGGAWALLSLRWLQRDPGGRGGDRGGRRPGDRAGAGDPRVPGLPRGRTCASRRRTVHGSVRPGAQGRSFWFKHTLVAGVPLPIALIRPPGQ